MLLANIDLGTAFRAVPLLGGTAMRNGLKAFLLAGSGGAFVLAGSAAWAQDAAGDDTTMSEIVVTAQKKSERLLDVPVSVAAVIGRQPWPSRTWFSSATSITACRACR
jgi:outer membrane receptor protein involved in Fe transport